jgi:ATP-dependent DNA helicase RecG
LCSEQSLQLRELAELLGRKADTLRVHYLNPMVEEGLLRLRYPALPNHPKQAYEVTDKGREGA